MFGSRSVLVTLHHGLQVEMVTLNIKFSVAHSVNSAKCQVLVLSVNNVVIKCTFSE